MELVHKWSKVSSLFILDKKENMLLECISDQYSFYWSKHPSKDNDNYIVAKHFWFRAFGIRMPKLWIWDMGGLHDEGDILYKSTYTGILLFVIYML